MMTTEQETRPTLDPEERKTLAGLADVLIPSAGRMPSASQARLAEAWVDHVLESRPDLAGELVSLLKAVEGQDPQEVVGRLQTQPGTEFDTLSEVVAGAYFLNPKVRDLLGYPGQRDIPIETSVEDLEKLTAPVVERGPIYRSCP
jgi:NDP-sugar pyrophosphorylase family protein